MPKNGANGVGENGNTKHSPRVNQCTKWCFTLNNYTENDIIEMESKFKEICKKYLFQEETGESGTKHLQGAIWLLKKARYTEFKLNNKIHWEVMRNEEASIKYCQKDETRTGKLYINGFPKPIKTIETLHQWQKDIVELYKKEPDGRTCNWYVDLKGGAGKSAFCKYMYIKHKVITIQGGKLADIMNIIFNLDMDEVTMIIIDVPRKNKNNISYAAVECILNGMITNTKYETGIKVFNPPHVCIFSNYYPDEESLSEDRWNIVDIGDP